MRTSEACSIFVEFSCIFQVLWRIQAKGLLISESDETDRLNHSGCTHEQAAGFFMIGCSDIPKIEHVGEVRYSMRITRIGSALVVGLGRFAIAFNTDAIGIEPSYRRQAERMASLRGSLEMVNGSFIFAKHEMGTPYSMTQPWNVGVGFERGLADDLCRRRIEVSIVDGLYGRRNCHVSRGRRQSVTGLNDRSWHVLFCGKTRTVSSK